MVSLLWKACQEGDAARVDELLADSSQDIEIKDHNGVTPLILAVKGGHSTIVQALLNRGANPNNASAQGRPETYSTDPYILQSLAVARGEISPYPQPAMHPQYYPYPPYYPYVQDSSWYLPHHQPQHPTARQEDHQPDPTDSTSTNVTTTTTLANPTSPSSNTTTNQQSHPSLPPPEIARNIPCRYFPACRYGSSCVFLHPTTPYFQGPLPPPAHYPHLYYSPLTYPLQGTQAVAAGSNPSAPVDSADQSLTSQQPSSSDQNREKGIDIPPTPTDAHLESNISASGSDSGAKATPVTGAIVAEGGPDHLRSPTSPTSYAHPGMVYMYPPMHAPPPTHSQDGSQMHAPPPPQALAHHFYPPPVPGASLSSPHHLSHPQSAIPLPHPHQHLVPPPPPPAVSQETNLEQQQPQPSHQGQLLLENQGQQPQLPTTQQAHPPHMMPYPPPPHIYPTLHPTHASWSIPPPPPPHPHHQPQLHPAGIHHQHMHPGASIPPPHPGLHSVPVTGSAVPAPPGPPGGPGQFGPRGGGPGRGGRRSSAAFRNDRDRDRDRGEGRERSDRERDRDRDRGDRFNNGPNGHYHHGGPHSSKKALCLFFPNGKCRNGDECRFSHVLPDANGSITSPLSPNGLPPGHRHSQSLSYRRSNYANGHSSTIAGLANGVSNVDGGDAQSPIAVGAGIGASTTNGPVSAGMTSSAATVDEILNAMTLDSAEPLGTGRRQHNGNGGRRGKHNGPHGQGGGGYSHSHNHGHGYGSGHLHHRSVSTSPSRGGGQQQQHQRVPTADDFPVLGNGSSMNGVGSSAATSATGRTTPIHPVSSGTSNASSAAVITNTTGSNTKASATSTTMSATMTTTAMPITAATVAATGHAATNGWSTPLVNGGAARPTAAQVVKEGTASSHSHMGAWGKAPPPSTVNAERGKGKEKDHKTREKDIVKEKETVLEVKVTV